MAQAKRTRKFELLERRLCLSVGFTLHPLANNASGPQSIVAADFNGDGRLDLLTTSWEESGTVEWFENTGNGDEPFVRRERVGGRHGQVRLAIPVDVDGDDDMDVIVSRNSSSGGFIHLYRNTGTGQFGEREAIGAGGFRVVAVDFDADGDLDLVTGVANTGLKIDRVYGVYWHENDGAGNFVPHIVDEVLGGDFFEIAVADLDNDRDFDVVTTTRFKPDPENVSGRPPFVSRIGYVSWYENLGNDAFSEPKILADDLVFPRALAVGDLDGDNRLDIITSSEAEDGAILRLTNVGGAFTRDTLFATPRNQQLRLEDLDNDGDLDILASFRRVPGQDRIVWYENLGQGQYSQENLITSEVRVTRYVAAADLDADGDLDVLSASRQDDFLLAWYESDLLTEDLVGDINHNGEVDFADFLVLAQNFGKDMATFADGDLNGDGLVSFTDFLLLAVNFGRKGRQ